MRKPGYKHTEETKRKIGQSKIGKSRSEETKRKLSEFRKGKTYEELLGKEKSDQVKKKLSEIGNGRLPWNKGIPSSDETKEKISNYSKVNGNPFKNKKHSDESKEMMKSKWTEERRNNARIEMKNWRSKYIQSFTTDQSYIEWKKVMLNGQASYMNSFIKNPSKPQIELYNLASSIFPTSILNFSEIRLNKCIDIAIPELMIAIEYDGSYWHQDEEKDKERQTELEKLGWKFIRYRDHIPSIEKLSEDIKCKI